MLSVAAHVLERQHGDRRFGRRSRPPRGLIERSAIAARRRICLIRAADGERIDADGLDDVFEPSVTEIVYGNSKPRLHLTIGVFGQADRAGCGDTFQSRGDIDAVAHEIAVALFDHVAEVDADPKLDAPFLRHACVALDHAGLHFDGAANGVHHAAEFDKRPIAGALHNPPVMYSDGRVEEVASKRPKPSEGPFFVCAGEPTETDDIRGKDGGKFPALGHSRQLP